MIMASWAEIKGEINHAYDKIESAYEKLESSVDKVKERRALNTAVKTALPFIPIIGPILSALYDNIGGRTKSEEDKAKQILEFLSKLEQQDKEQFDRIVEDLKTNRHVIIDAINENRIAITDLISISSKEILEEVGNVRSKFNSFLEASTISIKISNDTDSIVSELSVLESTGVSYIHREEDSHLEQAILNNRNKIVLIKGESGSGKSKMLYNALMYCKKYFSMFILIPSYFREGDEKSLDLVLSKNDIDNFVIVWDDLHEKKSEFVTDVIERIKHLGRSKNFRFIGASRKDIVFVREEGVCRVNLHRFDKITELVNECAKAFNVKLEPNVTPDKILSKGDGTPYYTITLFKMFKDKEITLEALNQLPSDVTALWLKDLETTYPDQDPMNHDYLNAFRSIGLLSHASSEPSQITKARIYEVYNSVFYGDRGKLDYVLPNLVENMFVSWVDKGYYYAHDSHIEALEIKYPLEKHHVDDFNKYESDSRNLWAFGIWAAYREQIEYLDLIFSRIIEIDRNDASAWYGKGLALHNLGRFEEAVKHFDKALEIKPDYAAAWSNKGSSLDNLGRFEEAIDCCNKAIKLDSNYASAFYNKGLVLSDLGNYEEAIKNWGRAVEIKPNYAPGWYKKALHRVNIGDIENGLADLKKAINIDRKFIELAKQERDFESIRNDERFKTLVMQ
jgi:hypothetical protein